MQPTIHAASCSGNDAEGGVNNWNGYVISAQDSDVTPPTNTSWPPHIRYGVFTLALPVSGYNITPNTCCHRVINTSTIVAGQVSEQATIEVWSFRRRC